MADTMTSWCILRTAGRSTLRLAETLGADGFEVWTPSELQRVRNRRGRDRVPILPTFVFAKACHLWNLVDLSEDPTSRHDGFSMFRYLERFPIIADEDLCGLREAENHAIPKADRPAFANGEGVMATDGPYSGLPGKVLRCKGGSALVLFGWQKVKISTFILKSDRAYGLQSETDTAVRAA